MQECKAEVTWPSQWTFECADHVRERNLRANFPLLIPEQTSSWPLARLAGLSTRPFLEQLLRILEHYVQVDEPLCASRCCVCERKPEMISLREYITRTWLSSPMSLPMPFQRPAFASFDTLLSLGDALSRLRAVAPLPNYKCSKEFCEGPLYLKDLHLDNNSLARELYSVPEVFEDDFLNPYFHNQYRFLYLGSLFTFTPLHADVLRSFSWTANVRGRKAWILFPPTEDSKHLSAFEHLARRDIRNLDETDPIFDQLPSHCFFMIQPEGSAFFVPSNWYHTVYNLDLLTLSINHNWFNATNIKHVFAHLQQQEIAVREELAAWDASWKEKSVCNETIQIMLKANAALDRVGLRSLLMSSQRRHDLENESDRASVASVLEALQK